MPFFSRRRNKKFWSLKCIFCQDVTFFFHFSGSTNINFPIKQINICLLHSDVSVSEPFQCISAIWFATVLPPFRVLRGLCLLRDGLSLMRLWRISFTIIDPLLKFTARVFSFSPFQFYTSGGLVDYQMFEPILSSSLAILNFIGDVGHLHLKTCTLQALASYPCRHLFYTFCERNWTFFLVSSQLLRSFTEGSFIFSLFLL